MAYSIILVVLIGGLGGLTGGLFGVGGSVVMIPALSEALGPNQHLYQATCMIVNVFVAGPAMIEHRRAGAVDRALVNRLIPLAALAIVAGVGISELPVFAGTGEAYLRAIFGLFLAFISAQELWHAIFRMIHDSVTVEHEGSDGMNDPKISTVGAPPRSWGRIALVAIPTGLIGGLLGVGGGLMAVPLQHRWLGVPMRTAIANSASVIVVTSFIGAVIKNYAYMRDTGYSLEPLGLAAVLIPVAMIGSMYGSRWVHRLPLRLLKTAFFLLLLAASVRLIYGAVGSLSAS